jgi:acetylornithine deacetylase/succinyl-diaminopimelate desuccinylase-like protein
MRPFPRFALSVSGLNPYLPPSMSRTAKLLGALIALPSVNPAFAGADGPLTGEQRVAEFLAATGAKAGLDVKLRKVKPRRPNLLAVLSPAGRVQQRILLAPHLDTINLASDEQLIPRRRGDRLYGRGACDTKGSVAAMFTALCEVARGKARPQHTEIVFAGLADEEHAQSGARALAASGFKADLAIVGEPTRLQAVTAHKGSLWLRVETLGRSAHGATPHLGRNAVHMMARVVDFLQTTYAAKLRRRLHPLLGHATVSVGSISGGGQTNIVPDRCHIEVDRRTLPGETEFGVCRELGALLRAQGLTAKVSSVKGVPCASLETDPNLPLVRAFVRGIGQRHPVGVHYFCDAAVLAEAGIPSIVFGPGDIAQAHTADEWISLASLERGKEMLVHFLKSLP